MKIRVVYDNGRAGKDFIDAVCALKPFDKRISPDEVEWSDAGDVVFHRLSEEFVNGDVILELHAEK